MDWLFTLTVAAGVISVIYMYTFLRRLPERRYRQQANLLADYVQREQQEMNQFPRPAPLPESENFLAACYSIIEKGE